MNSLIAWFARNGVAANLLMAAIILAGVYTLSTNQIGVEVFPEFEVNQATVRVAYRGATPEEVEDSIVIKIEEESATSVVQPVNSSFSRLVASCSIELLHVEAIGNPPGLADVKIVQPVTICVANRQSLMTK